MALLAFLVLPPVLPAATFGSPHDLSRASQTVLLVLVATCTAMHLLAANVKPSRWWAIGAAALGLAVLSASRADLPYIAAREVALLCGLIGIAWFVARLSHVGGIHAFAGVLASAWALYSAVFLILWALALAASDKPNSWLLVFGFDNPRFLNHAQTIALPLLLGVALSQGMRSAWRRLSAFALVVGFVLLAVTFGRATMLALSLATLLCAMLFGRAGLRFAAWFGFAAASGLLAYEVLFDWVPTWLATSFTSVQLRSTAEATSDHSRLQLWHIALRQIAESPWLGIGPMHFAHTPNLKGAHPHNVYLQLAAEYGLPFLALILASAGVALTRAASALRQRLARGGNADQDVPLLIAAFCACAAAAVDGCFSGNFVMPMSQVWIAVAAGLLMGGLTTEPRTVTASSAGMQLFRCVGVLLLATQLWLAALSISEFVSMDTPTLGTPTISAIKTSTDKWRPRFWRDGWF